MERQMTELDRASYLEQMRNKILDPDVIALIEADLKSGLTDKEIDDYATRGLNLEQMKAVSEMYHKKFPINVIAKIGALHVDAGKMRAAIELYEKNVAIGEIETALSGVQTAHDLRNAFSSVLGRVQTALAVTEEEVAESQKEDPESEKRPAYVDELVGQMRSVVEKINYQGKRYDALNQKLLEFQTAKKDEAADRDLISINERLEKEKKELSEQLAGKQDEIARGLQTVSRLRNEVENGSEEIRKMRKTIDGLQEEKSRLEEKVREQAAPVQDDRVLQAAGIEYTRRRTSSFFGIMCRFVLKKKSHRNLVQMVINKELSPGQINEITRGLQSGLDEEQLEIIINRDLSPERIRSIVGFAVMQNSLKTEGRKA